MIITFLSSNDFILKCNNYKKSIQNKSYLDALKSILFYRGLGLISPSHPVAGPASAGGGGGGADGDDADALLRKLRAL